MFIIFINSCKKQVIKIPLMILVNIKYSLNKKKKNINIIVNYKEKVIKGKNYKIIENF